MDVAVRRNRRLIRWLMGAMFTLLMPFAVLAQSAPTAAAAAPEVAVEQTHCRACGYERIGHMVDIGLVALVSLMVVGLLAAISREWGTASQRWTCRTMALLLVGIGVSLLWWAGSIIYLGYNPWQEQAAPLDAGWTSTLLSTSPKWLAALLMVGFAPMVWRRSGRLPVWRIA